MTQPSVDILRGTDGNINCPVCGEYTGLHLMGPVVVNALGEVTRITKHGTTIYHEAPTHRGSTIGFGFWCEYCHQAFHIDLEFHKGVVMYSTRHSEVGDCSPGELPRD